MKRHIFITIFLIVHVLFIAFQIDKQGRLVKISYEKQDLEQEKGKLLTRKQQLTNKLYTFKNHSSIKDYALKMGMKPIKLAQVKKVPHE